eukprot:scaffold3900_cov258-Pinguiococcus_pyrenoidosus.AAC.9
MSVLGSRLSDRSAEVHITYLRSASAVTAPAEACLTANKRENRGDKGNNACNSETLDMHDRPTSSLRPAEEKGKVSGSGEMLSSPLPQS